MADAANHGVIISDDGGGTARGWGLYIMCPVFVCYERYDSQCRPGMWRISSATLSDVVGHRITAHAVVDDFGTLVIVDRSMP